MDFQLLQLDRLSWYWVTAVVAAAAIAGIIARRRRMRRLAEERLLPLLAAPPSLLRQIVRAALVTLALASTTFALLDPRWGVEFQEVRRRGLDLVITIDASRSMLARDVAPDRLSQAKLLALDVVDRLAGERAALIGFGGVAAVRCPLTLNYAALRTAINELTPMEGSRGGSSIATALSAAADAFVDDGPQSRAILLITDGDDLEGSALEVTKELAERDIKLFIVGLGDSVDGARIPITENGRTTYLLDEGREVWTKMNPELLGNLALAADGAFVPAGVKSVDLGRFYETRIAELPADDLESSTVRQYTPRFQWFIALALGVLLLESLMNDRSPAGVRSRP